MVGASGSGKTTLLQLFNGILAPTSGRVVVDGAELSDRRRTGPAGLDSLRRRVGLVFQFPEAQLFEETVFRDVAFGPRLAGFRDAALEARVRTALERVGLDFEAFRNRSPFRLSGGEKRRAAIAGVLANDPELLALDEPLSGLDHPSAERVERILAEYHSLGRTVLFVSHDMDLVGRLADRVVVLFEGRVLFDGPKPELFGSAELLERAGLESPHVPRTLQALRERGLDVRTDLFTLEEAEREIRRAMGAP